MGVPAFYRWLVNKYPKIVVNALEDKTTPDHHHLVDITAPNPNGFEFDNLYLDMNCIIHPCFHPDNQLFPPTTFAEVFENIYQYIDHLVSIVRPRKLLYLAIDGVAPRAKLNQQRARRYRNAKDNQMAEEEEQRLRIEYERMGKRVLPKFESEVSDSNVITPGTVFMYELSKALKLYISKRLRDDPGWKDIKVILSDANVPGEGEHKIMSFLRRLRTLPNYDPNTRHCLYGLDADLIMLALATHELHFSILREEVITVHEQAPIAESELFSCIKKFEEHALSKSNGSENKPFFKISDKQRSLIHNHRYQFLHLWILREYLELDMQITDPPENFVFDIERMIDDFIFICFFAGNDFLPHMPTVQMHERCVDLFLHVYKKEFKKLGGYLVNMQRVNDSHAGYVKMKRVERFILSVGSFEESIFKKRTEMRERQLRRILSELSESPEDDLDEEFAEVCVPDPKPVPIQASATAGNDNSCSDLDVLENTKQLNEKLKNCIRKKSDLFRDGNYAADKVKLGSHGWKQRYYMRKFSLDDPKDVETMRKMIVDKYVEGLCWVLLYYFSGVPSWNWYYPYHYGPFASDLKGLAQVNVKLEKGLPFKPFDQLMAVLPPRSAHALPKPYQELMIDNNSSIIAFYPSDFAIDFDGKRFQWQGICKLPFIEQEMLLSATRQNEGKIEDTEALRNIQSYDQLIMRASNSDCRHSVDGEIWSHLQRHRVAREANEHIEAVDGILSFYYDLPATSVHIPRLLEGVQPPEKIILENDIMETTLWHEEFGNRSNSRFPAQVKQREAINNAMKMEMKNEMSPHKYPGSGHGSNSGRGKPANSYPSKPEYNYVNQRHQYNYVNSPVTAPQVYSPNYTRPDYYRPVMGTPLASNVAAPQIYNPNYSRPVYNRLAMASNYVNGSYQRGIHHTQNGFWTPRNGASATESCSWRSGSGNRASDGNNPQMMGRGRGRGQFRPNSNNRYSSQITNQRDHSHW